ncbi:dynamin family protein [Flavobacterium subsaxonicum]|uniref:Dynamin N-terminal domain-containing protein n=1 Tax=Flavobacterium subsaxonicum WB 4.1-42 = DSM 21790 TaxID=1121898 RepID=A0A0A2MFF4_9FLAO|nr:dynamin family protein [Flavobacterium subsaxonicum]KGO91019.1 hypothetical protein Q766_20230 [Flavobacterium subsaxonicum WB 4.1-42 = DSM 21790]
MNKINQNYSEQQELLLQFFDLLGEQGFVPCTSGKNNYDEQSLQGFKSNLLQQKFIVNVCGQIKAGKSSFLNYLLFEGRPVLPAAPTPWTAKLTQITYRDQPGAVIHYFSKSEWEALKEMAVTDEAGKKMNYYDTYLGPQLEKSALKGVHAREYITEKGRTDTTDKLDSLDSYVSGEGVFTPFVSSIELFTNNAALRNVVIVDTPGINDNNQLRSRVATDFINQSSAVLYLFHSTSPMHRTDYDFIDKYLSDIPATRLVFSASKCDLVKDPKDIAAHIELNMKNDPEFQERHLLDGQKVHPFSALAALIKDKTDNGMELTEDERFFKKKIQPELIAARGYIDEFITAIGTNIMNEKGSAVLGDAAAKILAIGNAKLEGERILITQKEAQINDAELGIDGLNARIKRIEAVKTNVDELLAGFEKQKEKLFEDIDAELMALHEDVVRDAAAEYAIWVTEVGVNKAIKLSAHEFKHILYVRLRNAVREAEVMKSFKKLEEEQKKIKEELVLETKEVFRRKQDYLVTPVLPITKMLQGALTTFTDIKKQLEAARVRAYWFFINREETRNNLLELATDLFEQVSKEFSSTLREKVHEKVDDFSSQLEGEITAYFESFSAGLAELQTNFSSKSELAKTYATELDEFKKNLSRLEKIFENIKKQIADKIE